MFSEHANPIGAVHHIEEIEDKIVGYSRLWDEQNQKNSNWFKKINFSKVTFFLIVALDDLILTVNKFSIPGADKKATVLSGLDRLYEYVMQEGMPVWLRHVFGPIKQYIIYVLVSFAIDWIVEKYKNGEWRKNLEQQQGG